MNRPPLLVASTNPGKLREFRDLLGDLGIEVNGLNASSSPPTVVEDGDSYLANAKLKALAIARWSNQTALADDSGLEVDALGGAPGIHSARFAGPRQEDSENVSKLLRLLEGIPEAERTARFHCVIVVARPDGTFLSSDGSTEGRITQFPRGKEGFGYDPVFFFPPAACTFAELPAGHKNRISHRAKACHALREQILPFLEGSES